MIKRPVLAVGIILSIYQLLFGDVPSSLTRKPDVPYFMEPYLFETIELSLFSRDVTGMATDDYGDLMWNPAFLSNVNRRSIYLDMNFGNTASAGYSVSPLYTGVDYLVAPGWYRQTYISGVQTSPQYNFAFLTPITEKLTIGIFNRALLDYGPFREAYYWDYRYLVTNSYLDNATIMEDLAPQRLEVDDNQQSLYGLQTDFMMSYQLGKRFDLGVKIGHYLYRRDGELFDSKWGFYPHSTFADLNDEGLNISCDQYTLGFGFLFYLNSRTSWGIYGEWITGRSKENSSSVDTSYSWSERATDPAYYNFYDYDLTSRQSFSAESSRPSWTIAYEKKISAKLTLRSFLKRSNITTDIGFSTFNEDTTFSERTYDIYKDGNYYFQKLTSHYANRQHITGDGQENSYHWQWFASLIYRTENNWSLFGGIQINKYHYEKEYHDDSDYYSASDNYYSYYDPRNYAYLNSHEKYYEYSFESNRFVFSVPIGIKARVTKEFYLIFGGELCYYLTDSREKGRLLYPEVIAKIWENETLIVDDLEEDRYEEYSSNPARKLTRSTYMNIGFAYKHPAGINLYVRSNGNIMETAGWNIGLEYQW